MTSAARWGLLAFILFASTASPLAALAGEVRVAVSAGLEAPAQAIARRFTARSGHEVTLTVAATGKLQAQITQGSRHQVFLSSDTARPARAEAAGRVVAGSLVSLGRGALVLWSPLPDLADGGAETLGPPLAMMRLGVPNPVTSTHGAAANAVLARLGLRTEGTKRIVVLPDGAAGVSRLRTLAGSSASTTAAEAADAPAAPALAAGPASSAPRPPPWPVAGLLPVGAVATLEGGSSWRVPDDWYPPLEPVAVLLTPGLRSDAARAFMAFLQHQQARDILAEYGYRLPGPGAEDARDENAG
jgi:molybdate transport system substrate-binding protein